MVSEMAMIRITTTAPMMAGVLSGEEELWSVDSEVSVTSTLGSGLIVEGGGSIIKVTLFGLTAEVVELAVGGSAVALALFGLTPTVVGLTVGGSRHSPSLRDQMRWQLNIFDPLSSVPQSH